MVDFERLAKRQIEPVADQGLRHGCRKGGVPVHAGKGPCAPAFIGLGKEIGHADGKCRIGSEVEIIQVIVVYHDHMRRCLIRDPLFDRCEPVEPLLPAIHERDTVPTVERMTHSRRMGDTDPAQQHPQQIAPSGSESWGNIVDSRGSRSFSSA